MTLQPEILLNLSKEQEFVCTSQDNIYLTACPGSGKTLTLTRRLAYLTSQNPLSRKWNIAITYTNRAADEITKRLEMLEIDLSNIWTGTIHQFCMQFIIRPYSMYLSRLSKGFTIIDEYVQREYCFEISKDLGLPFNYFNIFEYPEIKIAYLARLKTNKEIDFDQILQFSDELVRRNPFICDNISLILNSVLVDEFQDTNALQYNILSQICRLNKKLNLLFVGDVNQAIFGTLGGIAKSKAELNAMFDTNFVERSLTGCYRSTQQVIDFYTNFEVSPTGVISVSEIKKIRGNLSFTSSVTSGELPRRIAKIILSELSSGVSAEEICVVAPQWQQLFHLSSNLKELLPNVPFDAPDISPIKYDRLNPFYLIARLVFTESGKNVSIRKRVATELLTTLHDDFQLQIPNGIDSYDILRTINLSLNQNNDGLVILQNSIEAVFQLLKIQFKSEKDLRNMFLRFFEKIQSRVKKYSMETDYISISKYFKERSGVVLSTIHGIKGEEYTTVIAFSLLNGYLPNWSYIWDDIMKPKRFNETQKLLYVLCSRSKRNIYLFSEKGHKTKSGKDYTPTDELIAVAVPGTTSMFPIRMPD